MEDYFQILSDLLNRYAYAFVFLGLTLENTALIGFIFPGVMILLLTGFMIGNGELDLFLATISAVGGVLAGDNISFFAGRWLRRLNFVKRFQERNSKLIRRIEERSFFSLFFFQFPAYLRVVLPAFLGSIMFPIRKWILIDLVGTILFTASILSIGYFAGRATESITRISEYTEWILLGFAVVFTGWVGYQIFTVSRSMGDDKVVKRPSL